MLVHQRVTLDFPAIFWSIGGKLPEAIEVLPMPDGPGGYRTPLFRPLSRPRSAWRLTQRSLLTPQGCSIAAWLGLKDVVKTLVHFPSIHQSITGIYMPWYFHYVWIPNTGWMTIKHLCFDPTKMEIWPLNMRISSGYHEMICDNITTDDLFGRTTDRKHFLFVLWEMMIFTIWF